MVTMVTMVTMVSMVTSSVLILGTINIKNGWNCKIKNMQILRGFQLLCQGLRRKTLVFGDFPECLPVFDLPVVGTVAGHNNSVVR